MSDIGISKIAVSDEVDPGFGADTEQRRVEFAAQLEEEAFLQALQDATKIAKANLVTALKLWHQTALIQYVNDLKLRDIMIIWLVFQYIYFLKIFIAIESKETFLKLVTDRSDFINTFFKGILVSNSEDFPKTIEGIVLDPKKILEIRRQLGDDLLFGLEKRNYEQIVEIYEKMYSKLPKSLREDFYEMISGIDISLVEIQTILQNNAGNIIEDFFKMIANKVAETEVYSEDTERLSRLFTIIESFSPEAASILQSGSSEIQPKSREEIDDQVKRFYGAA